jgi:multidrug resistance efflux pump
VAELAAAQLSFDQLLTDQGAADVLEARARLAVTQERYEIARDQYFALLSGEEALTVKAGQAGLQQTIAVAAAAEANVALAEANVSQAEIAVSQAEAYVAQVQANIELAEEGVHQAEAMVAQAQKSLDLIDLQVEKLTVHAAVAGVVLNRNIETGELIQPGAAAMTLAQLDDLTVTVFIPENRYGQLQLGDKAIVTVDSFPDKSFTAVVVRIADEAEFTPRNVQTQEERQTTVYAVELTVSDANMQLKPGMPADVSFDG